MIRPYSTITLLSILLLVSSGSLDRGLLAEEIDPATTLLSQAEIEEFLLHAKIVMSEAVPIGVTQSRKATLSDGTMTKEAQIQTIDVFKKRFRIGNRTEVNFKDSYKFNIAAYEIDKALDLQMVPVSVERIVKGQPAAITWWIEDVALMELERTQKGVTPPDLPDWERQMSRVQVFTELTANDDQNQGNLLITGKWKIWLIDFTRAFRTRKTLSEPELLVRVEPTLLSALRRLEVSSLRKRVGRYLSNSDLKMLLLRRDAILAHFAARISRLGETAVLFSVS
jgi:hypothetical protein